MQLTNMGNYLRNILDFAVTSRLDTIEVAIAKEKEKTMQALP